MRKSTPKWIQLFSLGILTLLLSMVISEASYSSSVTSDSSQACPQLNQSIANLQNSVDFNTATDLAASQARMLNATYINILYNGRISGCTPTLTTVSLVYEIGGQQPKVLEISENPSSTTVLSVTIANATWYSYLVTPSTNWSGYQLNIPQTPLVQSVLTWNQPSASQGYSDECYYVNCGVSMWAGLTDLSGGGTKGESGYGIAQGGSSDDIYCTSLGCTSQDYTSAWIEFFPAASMGCGWGPDVGDSVYTNVFNPDFAPSSTYEVQVYDQTLGLYCSAEQSMSMGWAYYTQYMVEATSYCSSESCTHYLPKFSEVTTEDAIFCYVGDCFYVTQPAGQSITEFQMNNGQGNNTWNGPISSSTYGFPVKWLTSAGT